MKFNFFLLALVLGLVACDKDDDNGGNEQCTADVATLTGTYAVSKVHSITNGVRTDVTEQFKTMQPCMAAGVYVLKSDGNVTYTDPADCDQDNKGTWVVKNGIVTFTYPSTGTTFMSPVGDTCKTITIPLENALTSLQVTIRRQ